MKTINQATVSLIKAISVRPQLEHRIILDNVSSLFILIAPNYGSETQVFLCFPCKIRKPVISFCWQ